MKLTGIAHVHSTHSYDGKVSLPELKALCQKNGISFVCLSEHTDTLTTESAAAFVAECEELSDQSFQFIPGFEVPYKEAHVLHFGATNFISQTANQAQLQLWRKVSPLVVLAHPVRNQFKVDEALAAVLDGVEVWNQQYDGKAVPRARSAKLLRELRASRPNLAATAGLDFHRLEHFGAPRMTVEVSEFTVSAILSAIKAGQCSFGHPAAEFRASDQITLTLRQDLISQLQIAVIVAGKTVNSVLARVGIRLPRALSRAIRARV